MALVESDSLAGEALARLYVAEPHLPVRQLTVAKAFEGLSREEQLYAYHFTKASWLGARAVLAQVSHESPDIFDFLLLLFSVSSPDDPKAATSALATAAVLAGVSDDEWRALLAYAAAFFGNMGNYRSFGDTKFIPALPRESLAKVVLSCPAKAHTKSVLLHLWNRVQDAMYDVSPGVRELGCAPSGASGYYSAELTAGEAEAVTGWLREHGVGIENTRVFKRPSPHDELGAEIEEGGAAPPVYEVRIASAAIREPEEHSVEGKFTVVLQWGDHAPAMAAVARELQAAAAHAAGDTQRAMLAEYVSHFETGELEAHKASQRLWVEDKGPSVETNIGFIETYRDPLGVRAEFEGLVAVVNRETSARFGSLVAAAPQLLTKMPWPPEFEKDVFLRPDFTSLEVVAFAGSGVPAGINIPNYDDIRQNLGFKNVSLGNVLSAAEGGAETVTFISPGDAELYRQLKSHAFEVQVGTHELLGHGSGKMLQEAADGTFNFDRATLINPVTGLPVASWYRPGQTYDSVFGPMSSSLEECRAECTGCVMSTHAEVLDIFGYAGEAAADITYINWLHMARAGLLGLEFYSPASGAWRQAHMQARHAILRTMLAAAGTDSSAGPPFLQLVRLAPGGAGSGTNGAAEAANGDKAEAANGSTPAANGGGEGGADFQLLMNRNKIATVGLPAVADLLRRINIFKATADAEGAGALWQQLTSVNGEWLAVREVVLARKQPRPVYVQAHLTLGAELGGAPSVAVTEFEASHSGVIESFITRFTDYGDMPVL